MASVRLSFPLGKSERGAKGFAPYFWLGVTGLCPANSSFGKKKNRTRLFIFKFSSDEQSQITLKSELNQVVVSFSLNLAFFGAAGFSVNYSQRKIGLLS